MTRYSYREDPAVPEFPDDKPVIVFDGYCALCSGFADFITKHDRKKALRLLPAQSELGEALYAHYGLKPDDYETNLLIEDGLVRVKSDGSLAMLAYLGWPWKLLSISRIFPRGFRDWVYGIIAQNRLKWFGQKTVCHLPRPEDADRFL